MAIPHRKYLLVLSLVFAVWWALLAIRPWDRQTWLVENALAIAAAALLIGYHRKLLLSRVSYTLIFIFMCLHQVGAHFSYAEVPYDAWFQRHLGVSPDAVFGLQRNSFDRLVHFLYGLLVTPACIELLDRVAPPRGIWRYVMPVSFIMSHSLLFEMFEWLAASVFGGDLGQAYLGTQGDVWDAQKDMLLATLGSVLAVALLGLRGWLSPRR